MTHFVKDAAPDWTQCSTLEEYVAKLIQQGKRSSDAEFQTLITVYGKNKIQHLARKAIRAKEGPGYDSG